MAKQVGTYKSDWTASRIDAGLLTPVEQSLAPGHGGKYAGKYSRHHWVPASGGFARINTTYGDRSRDLFVLFEVQAEDDGGGGVRTKMQIHLHKDPAADVAADDPFVVELGRLLGGPPSVDGWREWRTAWSATQKGLAPEEVFGFFDEQLAGFVDDPVPADLPSAAPTPTPAPAASTPVGRLEVVPKRVFVASRIRGHASAERVRLSIKSRLAKLGFDAFIAEDSPVTGFRQPEIDAVLGSSEHLVVLIWDTLGPATLQEVALAREASRDGGHPLIHLFVSEATEHVQARDALTRTFLAELDAQGQYVRFFKDDRHLVDQVRAVFVEMWD